MKERFEYDGKLFRLDYDTLTAIKYVCDLCGYAHKMEVTKDDEDYHIVQEKFRAFILRGQSEA